MTTMTDHEVFISGAGPAGKILAILLGRKGHRVTLIDRQAATYPLPRAATHDSDFARILQNMGINPGARPDLTVPYDDFYIWTDAEGQPILKVDWSGRGESGWYNTNFFHQPALEAVFEQMIDELPSVTLRRGVELQNLRQHSDHVQLELKDNGRTKVETAAWLVGADGANSLVRTLTGMSVDDQGYFCDWLVIDVTFKDGYSFPHIARQLCDPARPTTKVPGGPHRRRWEFMLLPEETPEQMNKESVAWNLLAPDGVTPESANLERHAVYKFQARWAEQWRSGRSFIIGDAAHQMPPFAGQGLCAGIRDAVNLAWKLDAVLDRRANEKLLDTYGTERLHHARAYVEFSTQLGNVICVTDLQAARQRNERLRASVDDVIPKPPRPGLGEGIHTGRTGGQLSVQGRVRHGEVTGLLDDMIGGPGALIISQDTDWRPSQALRDQLSGWDIQSVPLGTGNSETFRDLDGVYERWLKEIGATAVLVRPDLHIFGAADSAGGLEDLAKSFLESARTGVSPAQQWAVA